MTGISAYTVLRNKYPATEYALLTEVANTLGNGRGRSLDYMVINYWQSRGLSIIGIEKKSNRGDWLKELKTPEKQEDHYQHCDYFYLLTDKDNVARIEEIPLTWGWYHITPNGQLKTLKVAPKIISKPVDRGLLCAMLRRAVDKADFVHKDSMESEINIRAERFQVVRDSDMEANAASYLNLKDKVDAFEKYSGINIANAWTPGIQNIGTAVHLIAAGGDEMGNYISRLERAHDNFEGMNNSLLKTIETLKALTN